MPQQSRCGQTCLGDSDLIGQAAENGLAIGADHLSRRQRLLPLADVGLVRRHQVSYIVGIAKNARLNDLAGVYLDFAARCHRVSARKVHWFTDLNYAAGSWDKACRVIVIVEHAEKGSNPRYVVTNLHGKAQELYDRVYCARGEMDNRIKEQQLGLFADRTSCHLWWPNQFRLLLASLAYVLMLGIQESAF